MVQGSCGGGGKAPASRGEAMPRRSPPLPGKSARQPAANSGGTTDKEAQSRGEQQTKTWNGANGLAALRAGSRLAQLERLRLRREQTERDILFALSRQPAQGFLFLWARQKECVL